MRVIGGQFRSRVLLAPPGTGTRPTSDRLRETLFNVLAPRLEGAHFADLYAGSGAVGIEALSRGARAAVLVEQGPPALMALRKNLRSLGLEKEARVEAQSVRRALERHAGPPWDVVFLDPPYELGEEYLRSLAQLAAGASRLLAPGALVVAEHARRHTLPEAFGQLRQTRLLEQGDAALRFYALAEEAAERKPPPV